MLSLFKLFIFICGLSVKVTFAFLTFLSYSGFKGTVVNRALLSLHAGFTLNYAYSPLKLMYLKTVQGAKHDSDGPPCTPTDYLQNGRYNVRTFMFKIKKIIFNF